MCTRLCARTGTGWLRWLPSANSARRWPTGATAGPYAESIALTPSASWLLFNSGTSDLCGCQGAQVFPRVPQAKRAPSTWLLAPPLMNTSGAPLVVVGEGESPPVVGIGREGEARVHRLSDEPVGASASRQGADLLGIYTVVGRGIDRDVAPPQWAELHLVTDLHLLIGVARGSVDRLDWGRQRHRVGGRCGSSGGRSRRRGWRRHAPSRCCRARAESP